MVKNQGSDRISISHTMDDIYYIFDESAVLRDEHLHMTKNSKKTNINVLLTAMV